jgi:hypothetical protein
MPVRLVPLSVIGFAELLLQSCSVELQIDSAMGRPLTRYEVDHLNKIGKGASGPGSWFLVGVNVPRSTAEKIVRWELYTHILIEDCRTGERVSIAPAVGVGDGGDSFDVIRKLLRVDGRQSTFAIGGNAFFQHGQSLVGLCARLEGGSYTLQKIASGETPIEFMDPS